MKVKLDSEFNRTKIKGMKKLYERVNLRKFQLGVVLMPGSHAIHSDGFYSKKCVGRCFKKSFKACQKGLLSESRILYTHNPNFNFTTLYY